MKNILIITAHPSSVGHTHTIANVYKEESEKRGYLVTILDLYKTENELPYLRFEDIRTYERHPNIARFQQMITEATEMVVVHPLWWGGAPAIMKNFFDQVFTSGFAYKYTKEGKRLFLLAGKTAKVFITAGGPMWLYRAMIMPPFKIVWKYMTFEYCGAEVIDFKYIGSMSLRGKEEKFEKFLAKVRRSADSKEISCKTPFIIRILNKISAPLTDSHVVLDNTEKKEENK